MWASQYEQSARAVDLIDKSVVVVTGIREGPYNLHVCFKGIWMLLLALGGTRSCVWKRVNDVFNLKKKCYFPK